MKVLDLFCGAGGAAMGLHQAWPEAEIVGVDLAPQPRYPFAFVQADAMSFSLEGFDFIWASPPCQGYSWTNHIHHCQQRPYSRLIEETRLKLKTSGLPYVIENVIGAPLYNPLMLCGTFFSRKLRRHRIFESSFTVMCSEICTHGDDLGVYAGKVTRLGTKGTAYIAGSGKTHWRPKSATRKEGEEAMGINWMNIKELSQAIPPVFSEYIARQFPLADGGRR